MVGTRAEVEVGDVAHGGFCIARLDGRAVFVRHALPGERVVVEITEGTENDRYWRADAVEVLAPSTHRVEAPCPVAGPGLCGGCDFQHAELGFQRELKGRVVAEQLRRLAGIGWDVVVEPVPGEVGGLRWRTRHRYAVTPDGGRGMLRHRSHDVIPVDECLLATEPRPHVVGGVEFEVPEGGFWQVHPGAPGALVAAVVDVLAPRAGESVLDLYAGVGLFGRFLGERAGGPVTSVEGAPEALEPARRNLAGLDATCVAADVLEYLRSTPAEPVDLVVLDPPRSGARRPVVEQVAARRPRAVAYVACDPAALARDVAIFGELGYVLRELRAFDLFPMTHHVECVALLEPDSGDSAQG